MTDVKAWTSLAAAREPHRMLWDPVKQRFVVPSFLEPEPEPEPEPEEKEDEEEPSVDEKSPAPAKKKVKKKKKKKIKVKKTKPPLPTSPNIVYAKPRGLQKR